MQDNIRIESDVFEHRELKTHFINPCCFGEDLADWLRGEIILLTQKGFEISEPIQEDYGWGLWVRRGKDTLWIALSYCGTDATELPAEWIISVQYDAGFNIMKRLTHRLDPNVFAEVRDWVWKALRSHNGLRVIE